MPFQSKAQERWAFSTGQPFAKKWAAMTDQASLPQKKPTDRLAAELAKRRRKHVGVQ